MHKYRHVHVHTPVSIYRHMCQNAISYQHMPGVHTLMHFQHPANISATELNQSSSSSLAGEVGVGGGGPVGVQDSRPGGVGGGAPVGVRDPPWGTLPGGVQGGVPGGVNDPRKRSCPAGGAASPRERPSLKSSCNAWLCVASMTARIDM